MRPVLRVYYSSGKPEALATLGTRKETTIERIYREVNGHKMPPSIKRILLPKRMRTRKVSRVANGKRQDEEIRRAILDELRRIRSVLGSVGRI